MQLNIEKKFMMGIESAKVQPIETFLSHLYQQQSFSTFLTIQH